MASIHFKRQIARPRHLTVVQQPLVRISKTTINRHCISYPSSSPQLFDIDLPPLLLPSRLDNPLHALNPHQLPNPPHPNLPPQHPSTPQYTRPTSLSTHLRPSLPLNPFHPPQAHHNPRCSNTPPLSSPSKGILYTPPRQRFTLLPFQPRSHAENQRFPHYYSYRTNRDEESANADSKF